MGGHQPLQPDVYGRMPPAVRELMPGVTGRRREDVYEYSTAPRVETIDETVEDWAQRSGLEAGAVNPLSEAEMAAALSQLQADGWCLLPDRLPAELTTDLARSLEVVGGAERAFGVLNTAERSWAAVSQPEALSLARSLLGPRCRAIDAVSLLRHAGALDFGRGDQPGLFQSPEHETVDLVAGPVHIRDRRRRGSNRRHERPVVRVRCALGDPALEQFPLCSGKGFQRRSGWHPQVFIGRFDPRHQLAGLGISWHDGDSPAFGFGYGMAALVEPPALAAGLPT